MEEARDIYFGLSSDPEDSDANPDGSDSDP